MSEIISFQNLQDTEKRLVSIADSVKIKLDLADDMACTEETKQAVKKYRAELKKEFESYETERKEKTAEYETPLRLFKEMYNKYIDTPYKEADIALKAKIDAVEWEQKNAKAQAVEAYGQELLDAYALDWLDVSRITPAVTLSASEKSLKTTVKEKADKIKSDIDCIHLIDDSGEMFAEYIKTLDLAQAKIIVNERRAAIEAAEKAKAAYRQQEEVKEAVEEHVDSFAPPTVEKEPEKVFTMTFTVTGTLEQLKALKAFMIGNNMEFRNGGGDSE